MHEIVRESRVLGYLLRTVCRYLSSLEKISKEVSSLGPRAALVLAAAVSDFYVPMDEMPENKIQSGAHEDTGLTLRLKAVPKVLGRIKCEWCPRALVSWRCR